MKTIFCDTDGCVKELQGIEIAEAKGSKLDYDQEDEIDILWIRPKVESFWFQIFIDDTLCWVRVVEGEQPYNAPDPEGSAAKLFRLSERRVIVDYDSLLRDMAIKSACARYIGKPEVQSEFVITFGDNYQISLQHTDTVIDGREILRTTVRTHRD